MDPERRPTPPEGSKGPDTASSLARAGSYAGTGLQFALSILLFLYVGQWVDKKLGTTPIFLVIGAFGGAAASFYSLYRRLMAEQRRDEEGRRGK